MQFRTADEEEAYLLKLYRDGMRVRPGIRSKEQQNYNVLYSRCKMRRQRLGLPPLFGRDRQRLQGFTKNPTEPLIKKYEENHVELELVESESEDESEITESSEDESSPIPEPAEEITQPAQEEVSDSSSKNTTGSSQVIIIKIGDEVCGETVITLQITKPQKIQILI